MFLLTVEFLFKTALFSFYSSAPDFPGPPIKCDFHKTGFKLSSLHVPDIDPRFNSQFYCRFEELIIRAFFVYMVF